MNVNIVVRGLTNVQCSGEGVNVHMNIVVRGLNIVQYSGEGLMLK